MIGYAKREIPLSDLMDAAKTAAVTELRQHPLVFLNSCLSGGGPGDSGNTFLESVKRLRVSALIGTEAPVKKGYAATIGMKILNAIIFDQQQRPVARLLWELKHRALQSNTGNPFILLYSMRGGKGLQTCAK